MKTGKLLTQVRHYHGSEKKVSKLPHGDRTADGDSHVIVLVRRAGSAHRVVSALLSQSFSELSSAEDIHRQINDKRKPFRKKIQLAQLVYKTY